MGVNITLPRLPKTLLGLCITNVARDALGPNRSREATLVSGLQCKY